MNREASAGRYVEPRSHCQNGGDVCLAGNADRICCPDDGCDIDDGVRRHPRTAKLAVMWAREIDGSWHACAKDDPGAVRFEETP